MYSIDKCHFCNHILTSTAAYNGCKNCKYDYRVWDDHVVTFMINGNQYNCFLKDKTIIVYLKNKNAEIYSANDEIDLGWIIIDIHNIESINQRLEKLKLFK